jgi:hypothetical protein
MRKRSWPRLGRRLPTDEFKRTKVLARVARRCFKWAEAHVEPTRIKVGEEEGQGPRTVVGIEEDARAELQKLASDEYVLKTHRVAAQLLNILLRDALRPLKSRVSKGDNTRHWAIWRMMTCVLEWSEYDPTKACTSSCRPPEDPLVNWHCPWLVAEDDEHRVCAWPRTCANALHFPYSTPHAAAGAVVNGFQASGIDSKLTIDRVLKHYQRHFSSR